jgi:hypothetical protein
MSKKGEKLAWIGGLAVLAGCLLAGCKSQEAQKSGEATTKSEEKHVAHHGGCLNAIETCAVGHAEVKIDGDVLKCWFVGGENETDKAVRATDKEIVLAVTPKGGQGQPKSLTLQPKPNELAGETVGDCSCFEGKADWLNGVKEFDATGKVNCKGKQRDIKIEYPTGYDRD